MVLNPLFTVACASILVHIFFHVGLYQQRYHSCSAALCPDPADIASGTMIFTGNSIGDTATYTCNSGFELIGNATVTCLQVDVNSAAFSRAPPVCRREYCVDITRTV